MCPAAGPADPRRSILSCTRGLDHAGEYMLQLRTRRVLEVRQPFVDRGRGLMEFTGHVDGFECRRDLLHLRDPAPGFGRGSKDLRFDGRQSDAALCELLLKFVENAVLTRRSVQRREQRDAAL